MRRRHKLDQIQLKCKNLGRPSRDFMPCYDVILINKDEIEKEKKKY